MVIISHQRDKCIGCNYCVELAYDRWRMSKKDGKATLLEGKNSKGFYTAKVGDEELENNIDITLRSLHRNISSTWEAC